MRGTKQHYSWKLDDERRKRSPFSSIQAKTTLATKQQQVLPIIRMRKTIQVSNFRTEYRCLIHLE